MPVSDWQARSPVIERLDDGYPMSRADRARSVAGKGEAEPLALCPGVAIIALAGNAGSEHPGQMHQVPGHDRGVGSRVNSLSKPVRPPFFLSSSPKGRPRPRLADPPAIGLRRDGVAEVVQREAEAHRDMLDPVFVAGDDGTGHLSVRRRTALPRSAGPTLRRAVRLAPARPSFPSPSQSGVPITRICAALTFSHSIGQSSRSQPCSVMSG